MINDEMTNALDSLSPDQLIALKNEINKRLDAVKADKIKALTDDMRLWDISPSDLSGCAKTHGKLPMKYQNPDNSSQQWSGKGKPPNWFKDCQKRGLTRTDLEII